MATQESAFNDKYFEDVSIIDVMKVRTSVRSYSANPVEPHILEKLSSFASDVKGPFDTEIRIDILHNGLATGEKLGTYGVIKGASTYIVPCVKKGSHDLEQLGYVLERVILYATSLGLGTCWLGGTFKRSSFVKNIGLQEDEFMPAITPVGYPSDRKRLLDTMMRKVAGSDNRKSWENIFFKNDFGSPLSKQDADIYKVPLEMVRIAPSASNKQPWKVVKRDHRYDFYLASSFGYSKAFSYNIQRIDIGIALCHFQSATEALKLNGQWRFIEELSIGYNDSDEKNPKTEAVSYFISWVTGEIS